MEEINHSWESYFGGGIFSEVSFLVLFAFIPTIIMLLGFYEIPSWLKLFERIILEELGLPGVGTDYDLSLDGLQFARNAVSSVQRCVSQGEAVDERLFMADCLPVFLKDAISPELIGAIRDQIRNLQKELELIGAAINDPEQLADIIAFARFSEKREHHSWSPDAHAVLVARIDSQMPHLDDRLVPEAFNVANEIMKDITARVRFLDGCFQMPARD